MRTVWHKPLAVGLLALVTSLVSPSASSQSETTPMQLTGTLQKVHESGVITIGHRVSSVPFSYLSARGEPIGYSIDLCKLLVDAISEELGRTITIKWLPITSESRIEAVSSGRADLECGSTTNNLERQKLVSFSPTLFVSGTKLMVKRGSALKSFRDLAGRSVVVTAGTTNEKTLRDLIQKFKFDTKLLVATDHAASFAMLTAGQADAFATDDVLLYGLLAQNKLQAEYSAVGEFLSYDPYGIMYRKGDAQLARLINDSFHQLAEEREIERRYNRWFPRKLPSGVSLDLPMSPQLESLMQALGARTAE